MLKIFNILYLNNKILNIIKILKTSVKLNYLNIVELNFIKVNTIFEIFEIFAMNFRYVLNFCKKILKF